MRFTALVTRIVRQGRIGANEETDTGPDPSQERKNHMEIDISYTSKSGIVFDVLIETAQVPPESDFWGFYIRSVERSTGKGKIHKAYIKKNTCISLDSAEMFILEEPLDYLKSIYLDHYRDGSYPMTYPDISSGWAVT